MTINTTITYTLYLESEEFELLNSIVKELKHEYDEEEQEYVVIVDEDMLYDIKEKLEYEAYIQEYEECNSYQANRITSLLCDINHEL